MSSRIDWRVAGDKAVFDQASHPASGAGSAAAVSRRWPGPRFWFAYLATLALAAVIGFGLGRFSESRAGVRDGLEAQLALERIARGSGDVELFSATLDPEASPDWRAGQLATFVPEPDAPVLALQDFRLVDVELALAEIGVVGEDGLVDDAREPIIRHYRLHGDRWYHTASPD